MHIYVCTLGCWPSSHPNFYEYNVNTRCNAANDELRSEDGESWFSTLMPEVVTQKEERRSPLLLSTSISI